MTTENLENLSSKNPPTFVVRFLPWMIAAGVLLVYLFTLNHWVTFKSLPSVAKITGWDWHPGNASWRPSSTEPLLFLLTYPFRWLSGDVQLMALNLFSAICAALTLGLLARSVSILPHDRTREQRQRETGAKSLLNVRAAWLPPLIATLMCGLHLAFWENATALTGEMLNLLVFAYLIRCLLEFRVSEKENWLTKFALVYGLGVTNNWALIGFFPFFLTALVWIKGSSFFNFRFISRITLFGLAGLSLYLLLPLVAAVSPDSDQTFFQALLNHLRSQKAYVFDIPFRQYTALRGRLAIISLTSLLPLLMIGIRWPSFRGDLSAIGGMITAFMFRLVHLFFLGILLSLFFDPPYSARELGFQLMPYLTFYYLSALAVGYFVGYALLVFGREPMQAWARPSALFKIINLIILVAVCVAGVAAPVVLAQKNFPAIRATNSNAVNQFANFLGDSLPKTEAVILSDDPLRLYLLQAANAKAGKSSQNIFLETKWLKIPAYHRYLHQHFPNDWPAANPTNPIVDIHLVQQVEILSKTRKVFYLQPSFGYYLERFYLVPHKLVYELKPYSGDALLPPPLANDVISDNQKFWDTFAKETLPVLPGLGKQNSEIQLINSYYSRSLNYWGTQLQKSNRLKEAGQAFAAAVTLNPENAVAMINQQANTNLQRGELRAVQPDTKITKALGQFDSIQSAILWNGPFDEREFCVKTGLIFGNGGNFRQSAQNFMRALEFAPKDVDARIGLAKTYLGLRHPEESLKIIQQLRQEEKISPLDPQNQIQLLHAEALAHLAKNDFPGAEKIVLAARQQNPKDPARAELATQFYRDTGRLTNALEMVQKQLQLAPDNPRALFTKGVLQMQLGDFAKAAETFDQVLKLQPKNFDALLNRAIAHVQNGKVDASKRDYAALLKSLPKGDNHQSYLHLAELAELQKDKSEAIKNYKIYLKRAPQDAPDRAEAQKRIAKLQGGRD